MEQIPSKRKFKLSSLWTCHRSIEASCTQRTDALLKFVDSTFADMLVEMDNAFKSAETGSDERALSDDDIDIDHRSAVDRIRMLTHVKGMQLEIARRLVQKKQDELKALAAEKSKIIAQANERRDPAPLPHFPNEILAQIISYSYWSGKASGTPGFPDLLAGDDRNPLQLLLEDDDTPVEWKNFINKQIPCVVTTFGVGGDLTMYLKHFGPHPRMLPLLDAHQDFEDVFERPSTIILINLAEISKVMEELESIRQKPWHNVFISTFPYSPAVLEQAFKSFVQKFRDKLVDLGRLCFPNVSPFTLNHDFIVQATSLMESARLQELPSKFKSSYARLPLCLLPTFHPVLSNITELETTVPLCDSGDETLGVGQVLQVLMLCSNALTNLKISDGHNLGVRDRKLIPMRRLSFPRLERFVLDFFVETIALNILPAMHCPLLRHFTLSICLEPEFWDDVPRRIRRSLKTDGRLSATLLHSLFPDLEYISVTFGNFDQDAQFLSDLAAPDESENWIFPLLDSMKFGSSTVSLAQIPLLKAVAKVVVNRMLSDVARSIRYLSIPSFMDAESADCDTLKLFVPELQFIPSISEIYGWSRKPGW
ncbi:hypothetical protein SCHPADRAFT_261955 [Schizopora paradoxa]|uniref:Uncharacterized protein n=1 Tax=Schizopora paradoxa TaxID=27342 RepID=A0A0H2RUC0_9AGAM|nr:hypothetical protein SCHPADRAFT_261955 [Schizopora paradoxa]